MILAMIIANQNIAQQIKKISRVDLVGEKIKFLIDNDNKHGYQNVGESKNGYPYLVYEEYKGRIATIIEKNNDIYTMKMDDNDKLVYFKHYSFSDIPNNLGILSLLEEAKQVYLGKTLYNEDMQECRIIDISFAEDNGRYSQLYGPYNVTYVESNDTSMVNVHFTETYGPEEGYTYDYEKEAVFSNKFTFENPFVPLTSENIKDKFAISIDDMDDKTTYLHKNIINNNMLDYGAIQFDYDITGLFSEVIKTPSGVKIRFFSNYSSDDWIFHSYVKIKIGDIKKETSEVKSLTQINDGISETNYYSSTNDIAILKWIAKNFKEEITIRLYGREFYDDRTLPMNIKLALKETYDLYLLLRSK